MTATILALKGAEALDMQEMVRQILLLVFLYCGSKSAILSPRNCLSFSLCFLAKGDFNVCVSVWLVPAKNTADLAYVLAESNVLWRSSVIL